MNLSQQPHSVSSKNALLTRRPSLDDGAEVQQLVSASGGLEANTTYAYLLLSHHFSDTCVVAELKGKLVGCALGYRLPQEPRALFLWQIGVAPDFQGQGIGKRLLRALSDRPELADIERVELTIAPSNLASRHLFQSWALEMNTYMKCVGKFERDAFGPTTHEEEDVLSIGPLNWKEKNA
jgi:L-2,4-diaminobutyric acid acetyltransferase